MTNKNVTMGDKFVTTYYVRDPQGNVLAVYEHKHGDSDNGTFTLAEQHLYGASRLGMRKRDLALNINSGVYYNVFYKGELIESYGGYKEEGLLEGLFGEDVGETVNMPEKLKNFNVDEIKKKYEEKHGDSNQ